jgi:isoquinoline 1-oxidoreductase beta subunit
MTPKTDKPDGMTEIDRREFLTTATALGGAMVLGFWLPPSRAEAAALAVAGEPWYHDAMVPEINAWITIAPDDTVTIRVAQTDIGTGVFTANPMMVAEELQCDWSKVRAEYASANRDLKEKAPEWTLKVPGNGVHDPAGGGEPVEVKGNRYQFLEDDPRQCGACGGGGNAPGSAARDTTRGQFTYDGVYRRMVIHSSGNVRESRFVLQLAGAEARERLLLAAATEWGVPVSELVAKDSVITHARSKRRTTYGAMAARAATIQLPNPAAIRIKSPDRWTLMGTEQKDRSVPLKVTGEAKYSVDVRLPRMLYAAVKCCPVWGGGVRSYNADAIKNRPGVHSVVQVPLDRSTQSVGLLAGGVAVVADTWWHAHTALEALPIEWEDGPDATVSSASLFQDHFAALKQPGVVVTTMGDVDASMGRAARVVEATYTVPFSPRARMEPGNATVLVGDGRVDVWTGDQNPQRILRRAAALTGVAPENVYVHLTFLGGGYGNDGNGPQAEHAVFIANAVKGRPVKTLWTREEDWGSGTKYRPMGVGLFKAGLDADGWPIAMDVRSIGGMGQRGLVDPPYFVPNYRCTEHRFQSQYHVPRGTRRGTGAGPNAFYVESFIDELAHAAGKDPYLYRRELIARNTPEPKVRFPHGSGVGGFRYRDDWLRALDMVAKMSGWGTRLPDGWARGIAIDDRRRRARQGAICAEVHTVEITRRGQLRLHRVDVAFDTGFKLVNPLAVRKQIEGQIAWGYSDALYQETTISQGRAVERNFDTFPVSRMNEFPREVNIAFFRTEKWIEGAGEEAIPQVMPAICNAVFTITGKRIRSVPLKNHDLSWG